MTAVKKIPPPRSRRTTDNLFARGFVQMVLGKLENALGMLGTHLAEGSNPFGADPEVFRQILIEEIRARRHVRALVDGSLWDLAGGPEYEKELEQQDTPKTKTTEVVAP